MSNQKEYSDTERLDILERRIAESIKSAGKQELSGVIYGLDIQAGYTLRQILDGACHDFNHGTPIDSVVIVSDRTN